MMENSRGRPPISDEARNGVLLQVQEKMQKRLRQKGPGCFASSHEALGIVTEEFHELVAAVESNDPEAIDDEMLDVAVATLLAVMSRQSGGMDW
jgi:DNA-binding FadR family transcriptional regulator